MEGCKWVATLFGKPLAVRGAWSGYLFERPKMPKLAGMQLLTSRLLNTLLTARQRLLLPLASQSWPRRGSLPPKWPCHPVFGLEG